jgi:hypothetical protein
MQLPSIRINEIEYPVVVNFNTIRKFLKSIGLKKLSDFDKLFSDKPAEDVTIDDIENRALLMLEGIKEAAAINGDQPSVSIDDIFRSFSENGFGNFYEVLSESMPEPGDNSDKKKAEKPSHGIS